MRGLSAALFLAALVGQATGHRFFPSSVLRPALRCSSADALRVDGFAVAGSRTIDVLPYVIDRPGHYRLAASLETAGDGIVVRASHVTIDGGFHRITHRGTAATRCCGLRSNGGCSDVVVRNLRIDGFFYNVRFDEDYERLRCDAPTCARNIRLENIVSTEAYFRGIRLDACDSTVTRCSIQGVGGTEVFADAYIMGIEVYGPKNVIAANCVTDVVSSGRGEGVGVSVSDFGEGTQVVGNRIENRDVDGTGDIGIWIGGRSSAHLRCNYVSRYSSGLTVCGTSLLELSALDGNACAACRTPYTVDEEYERQFRTRVRVISEQDPEPLPCSTPEVVAAWSTPRIPASAEPQRLSDASISRAAPLGRLCGDSESVRHDSLVRLAVDRRLCEPRAFCCEQAARRLR